MKDNFLNNSSAYRIGTSQLQLENQKNNPFQFQKIVILPSSACIIIPTFNESENIKPLITKIFKVVEKYNQKNKWFSMRVLVVDDNSPDGTSDIVRKMAVQNPRINLLVRKEKEGLGAAYIAGMLHVIKEYNSDIIIQMDADGQHDPKYLPNMIDEILINDKDYVIGSRYVQDAKLPDEWGFHRKLISYLARTTTRIGLGLGNIKDTSGGYKAIKIEVLKNIDLENLPSKGFSFQAALLESAIYNGYEVSEIPISFKERALGESKMRIKDMAEGFLVIYKIRRMRILNSTRNFFL
jgi:dolichol-phosphate mannosyltransferase